MHYLMRGQAYVRAKHIDRFGRASFGRPTNYLLNGTYHHDGIRFSKESVLEVAWRYFPLRITSRSNSALLSGHEIVKTSRECPRGEQKRGELGLR